MKEKIVLEVPKWDGKIRFTENMLEFCMLILFLLMGVLLCFWGQRFFLSLLHVFWAIVAGWVGVEAIGEVTKDEMVKMVFFIIFLFLGSCFLLGLENLLGVFKRKKRRKFFSLKITNIACSLLGACFISGICYLKVYRSLPMAISLLLCFFVLGVWRGRKNWKTHRPFYTYEDLYQMKAEQEEMHDGY